MNDNFALCPFGPNCLACKTIKYFMGVKDAPFSNLAPYAVGQRADNVGDSVGLPVDKPEEL